MTLGAILAVIAILSATGLLYPLLGWLTHGVSHILDALEDLTSRFPGDRKRGDE